MRNWRLQKKKEGWNEEKITQEIQLTKDSLAQIRENPTSPKSYSREDNTFAWWNSTLDIRIENSLLDLNIPVFDGSCYRRFDGFFCLSYKIKK